MNKAKIIFPEGENVDVAAAARLLGAELPQYEIVLLSEGETTDRLQEAMRSCAAGECAAVVAGADLSSRDVILSARNQIGMREGGHVFTSLFVCELPTGERYILSDGATCKNPTAEQLAEIVDYVADAARKILNEQPRIALLSFSTAGSGGHDPSIDKLREVKQLLAARQSPQAHDYQIDGEMQLDAAVNPQIGAKKFPDSPVAGRANVLIVPDINAGNILYKSLEQFAHARVAGPILLGFRRPVSDLSRGSTTEDIVFTTKSLIKLIEE